MNYLPRLNVQAIGRAELPAEILACDFCGSYRTPVRSYLIARTGHPLAGRGIRADACLRCRLDNRLEQAQSDLIATWDRPATLYTVPIG